MVVPVTGSAIVVRAGNEPSVMRIFDSNGCHWPKRCESVGHDR